MYHLHFPRNPKCSLKDCILSAVLSTSIANVVVIAFLTLLASLFVIVQTASGQTYAAPQLIPEPRLSEIKASLPDTENDIWQDVFKSPDTLFYTEREMPQCYQNHLGGFHSPSYNVSGDNQGPHHEHSKPHGQGGNANIEFPWQSPGGTDLSGAPTSKNTVKFMKLPRAGNKSFWPVVIYGKSATTGLSDRFVATAWSFPVETVFGEILYLQDPAAKLHCFEIRLRIRRPTFWDVEILKPVPTYADLQKALGEIDVKLTSFTPDHTPIRPSILEDTLHPNRAFRRSGIHQELPPLPPDVVTKLLDSPFKPSAGLAWAGTSTGVGYSYSPTISKNEYSIVPPNYNGTFLGTNHVSCKGCHEHTMRSARSFDQQRGWYGLVRGSDDGIFSFHPIDPRVISYNGAAMPVRFRQDLLHYGITAVYDGRIHTPDVYTSLPLEEKGAQH